MYGLRGPPTKSDDRYLSKLFDYKRKKAKENGNTTGCDDEFLVRDLRIGVGKCTRGGLRVASN
jgi:hypothetical protein